MPEHYSPLAGFVIAAVSAIAMPRLMERLKLPAVLGYIAAGVLIGPAMLGVVQKDGAVITWLAEIGKLLFMFFVGFEIDLALFNSTRSRAVVFGSLTFAIPLTAGILLGRAFGYSWVASLLIGSIIASHTLLAYPVLQRLGVLGNEVRVSLLPGPRMRELRSAKARTRVGVWLALVACPALLRAQPGPATAAPPPLTFKSLGQPPVLKPYLAGSLTWNREGDERLGGVGVVGLYKDLMFPPMSPFGVSAEGSHSLLLPTQRLPIPAVLHCPS